MSLKPVWPGRPSVQRWTEISAMRTVPTRPPAPTRSVGALAQSNPWGSSESKPCHLVCLTQAQRGTERSLVRDLSALAGPELSSSPGGSPQCSQGPGHVPLVLLCPRISACLRVSYWGKDNQTVSLILCTDLWPGRISEQLPDPGLLR